MEDIKRIVDDVFLAKTKNGEYYVCAGEVKAVISPIESAELHTLTDKSFKEVILKEYLNNVEKEN